MRRQFFKIGMQWSSFTPRKTLNTINLASLQLFSGVCNGANVALHANKKGSSDPLALLHTHKYGYKNMHVHYFR